jgi:hypothetical protein
MHYRDRWVSDPFYPRDPRPEAEHKRVEAAGIKDSQAIVTQADQRQAAGNLRGGKVVLNV